MNKYYCKAPLKIGDIILIRPVEYFRRHYPVINVDDKACFKTILPMSKDKLEYCDTLMIIGKDSEEVNENIFCFHPTDNKMIEFSRDCFKKVGKSYGQRKRRDSDNLPLLSKLQ